MSLIVLALVAVLFLSRDPLGCKSRPIVTSDTTTKTVYITQPTVFVPQYTPQQSGSVPIINIPPSYQPSTDDKALRKQYDELVRKFLATNKYKDSITLKDSSGKRVGVVNLEDEVNENQLKSRKPNYQLSFPHTTTVITNTLEANRQLYLMGDISGTKDQLVNGGSAGLMYKDKKDKVFYAKAGIQSFNNKVYPQVSIGTAWKINLRKKK